MLKLTKKADYGLIAVKHLAESGESGSCSAKDIAEAYGIPQPAMAKILQKLVKSGLLISQQGINGGYVLARDAKNISALEVIKAIDGPLFITSCADEKQGCYQGHKCTVREPLRKVNQSIQQVLGRLSIADMKEQPREAEEKSRIDQRELVTLNR
ncbi:MAG: SUF system Fe-S cluster assembly regulator [Acidobacteriia bacterium]|nr:SUF system Fe-S cluster assembly regulator [Terriglobia bacterium]